MLLKKRTVGRLFTLQTSFNPIPYVCCWQFLRRSNFENTVFARWPWHPSPNNVSFAWNSIPRSKFAYSIHVFHVEIYNFWGAFHLHGQAGQIVIFTRALGERESRFRRVSVEFWTSLTNNALRTCIVISQYGHCEEWRNVTIRQYKPWFYKQYEGCKIYMLRRRYYAATYCLVRCILLNSCMKARYIIDVLPVVEVQMFINDTKYMNV